ncbi:MAG: choice-of-anchor D domain-containing protein [Candidatus Kapabacteria bacterium]|nr:choice-of-anchor D domain-containing protein [Candidatus Kapabacteria bacterium]
MKRIIILIIIYILSSNLSEAQKLSLFRIDSDKFPIVSADIFVTDKSGKLMKGLSPNSFSVYENGKKRKVISLDCPTDKEPEAISSILTFDISGSMSSGAPNIDLVKAAGKIWVNSMPLGKSECGITSFNQYSYINQDFSTDKELLLKTIDDFKPRGGTDYNEAFLNPLTGNINLAKKGKAKKIIVFLTDGMPNTQPNEEEIIKQAKENNIIIFSIAVGMRIPSSLKNISQSTGGTWFEKVATPKEIEAIYLNLLEKSQGGRPCELVWESELDCDSIRNVEINLIEQNISEFSTYKLGSSLIPILEISPQWYSFGVVQPPQKAFKDFQIKALNQKVEITNIEIPDTEFKLETQINYPIILTSGQSINLRLSFQPKDTLFKYLKIIISSNSCNENFILINAGAKKEDDKYELTVIYPNGGERIKAGSKTKIKWSGAPPEQPVDLFYAINNGFDWIKIGSDITGNEYLWQVPDTISEECLVRVSIASNSDEFIKLSGHKAKINAIEWGNDYNTILSGGSDKKTAIWNIIQKKKFFELAGHNGSINSISINKSNSAATSSDDGTIKIWDLNNQTLTKTLYGHANKVSIAKWLNSNNILFSGSYDSDIRIWNVSLGQSGKPLDNHLSPVLAGDNNSDGSFIVTGGVDKKLIFWDVKSNSFLTEINVDKDSIISIDWNKKGNLIACGFNDGLVKIYDADKKTQLKSFKAHQNSVKSLEFSPDSKFLATASEDKTIKMWDTQNFDFVKELRGHKESVNCVRWRNDGLKIASCSDDSTVIIWDFLANSDVSDSLWAITKPNISSFDLDLGQEYVGNYKDSVVNNFIFNQGNGEEVITNLSISGLNEDEFEIVSPLPPFIINQNVGQAVEIRFKPNSIGAKSAEVIIESETKTIKQKITAYAITPEIELLTRIVDFGAVPLGDKKQKIEALLKNKSSKAVEIISAQIIGPDEEQFKIIAGNERYILQPDESRELTLEFAPKKVGKTSTEIEFKISNVSSPISALLYGEGLGREAKITVEIKDKSAKSGEIVNIPVHLIGGSDLYKLGVTSINTTIKLNPTILLPIEPLPLGVIKNGQRYIEINIPIINKDTIITYLNFLATWGNAEETDIIPENTYSMGHNLTVTEISGKFRLADVCFSGGTRLYIDSSWFYLSEISPNPVSDKINFTYNIIENDYFELFITDIKGQQISFIDSGKKTKGIYQGTVSTINFVDGVYYLILKNGSLFEFRKFVISKK